MAWHGILSLHKILAHNHPLPTHKLCVEIIVKKERKRKKGINKMEKGENKTKKKLETQEIGARK